MKLFRMLSGSFKWFTVGLMLLACSERRAINEFFQVEALQSPTIGICSEPYLATYRDTVYMSWLEMQDTTAILNYASLNGSTWSTPRKITSGSSWFVNWADFPSIAIQDQSVIAHFLDRSGPDKYSYDVKYVVSDSAGQWSSPVLLNNDGKEAEHGFVSIVPYENNFFVAWLDGRNTSMEGMDHDGHGAMSLRAAVIDKLGNKVTEWLLDERVCDCCQTSAAITANGPVVVYRDRSEDEIRDMSIVRWQNGSWTKPQAVHSDNWKINGCPVNGPRVSAQGNDLVVIWYSAPDDSTQVKVIFSHDAGATFSDPVLVNNSRTIGRVDVELLEDITAAVTWIENDSIRLMTVNAEGQKSLPAVVSAISSERASGFPQMTKTAGRLVFAWTDDLTKSVKTASATLRK